MINNLDIIKDLVKFESSDEFLHLQILKRKKENPDLGSNSYVVKTFYVRSWEYLESKMPEIINLCDFNNARACINLNKRSFESMAFHALKKVTDQIMNKDFRSVHKAYESVCGAYCKDSEKKWIIDIDWVDGPKTNEVHKIAIKYQYGHFDGSTDTYENSNNNEDLPHPLVPITNVKLVSVSMVILSILFRANGL